VSALGYVDFVKPKWTKITQAYTSTSVLTSVKADYFYVKGYKTKLVEIQNKSPSYTVNWTLLGSNDKSEWHALTAQSSLSANSNDHATVTDPWEFLDVKVVDGSAQSHVSGSVIVVCSTL